MGTLLRAPRWRVITSVVILGLLGHFFFTGTSARPHNKRADQIDLFSDDNTFSTAYDDYGELANLTGRGAGIEKRALAPASSDDRWHFYVCKGLSMESHMLNDAATITQAGINQVTDVKFADLRRDYTNRYANTPQVDMTNYYVDLHLAGLNGVENFPSQAQNDFTAVVTYDNNLAEWLQSYWVQDKNYVARQDAVDGVYWDKRKQQPTNAWYQTIYSRNNRVMIIRSAASPALVSAQMNNGAMVLKPAGQLPKMQRWSDLAFSIFGNGVSQFQYTDSNPNAAKFRPPTWYLIEQLVGPAETLEVVSACLSKYGWLDPNNLPTFNQRMTFPMGTSCYHAMLGTSNSAAIGFFLIEHKYRFGQAALGSVTIWGSGNRDPQTGFEYPSVLWWASRLEEAGGVGWDLKKVRDENYEFEENSFAAQYPLRTDWPHTMKPTYAT